MRWPVSYLILLFATCLVPLSLAGAADDETAVADETPLPFNQFSVDDFMNITLHADLWLYHIRTEDAYHTRENAAFTEVTARLGADITFADADWFSTQFRVVGTDVHSRPDSWTAPRRTDWGTRVDLANATLSGAIGDMDTSLTLGIQELAYGDGLLIFDGVSEKRAIWTTPLRSFPAAKLTVTPCDNCSVDFFAAIVDEDHLSWEGYLGSYAAVEGGGQVYGTNVNCLHESLGTVDVGLFVKDEDIRLTENGGLDTGSNTWALSVRDSKDIGQFNVTGEVIKQWGRTRVVQNSLAPGNDLQSRSAWGGQASLRYNFECDDFAPYVTARYAYFQGDRRSTSTVESFDPFFYGFYDWGYWYLGDMTSYSLTNTNEKVISLELGCTPTASTKLRVFLYDFALDRETPIVTTHSWSNEVNVVFDYFPCDYAFVGAMVGAADPGSAAATFNGDDETQTEVMFWAGLYF